MRERLARAYEFTAPGPDGPEVRLQNGGDRSRNLVPFPAQVAEVQLVERHGSHRGQLLALEGSDLMLGRSGIQGGELASDGVQAPYRASVVVFVVADQQSLGESVQRPRPDCDRCYSIGNR